MKEGSPLLPWGLARHGLLFASVPLAFQCVVAILVLTVTFSDVQRRQRQIVLAIVIALGIATSIAIALAMRRFFEKNIRRRIALIVDKTHRLERGEPLGPLETAGDEIGLLDRRFHEMAETLEAHRREVERTTREIESFSYSVSHDLRAPLRAVNGYARMLEEDCAAALDSEGRRYIATIRAEAQRMGELIDDLLTLSRLGRNELRASRLEMSALVREVLETTRGVEDARVAVAVDDLPPARADRGLIRQALVNLVSNALKFSRRRERIEIEIGARADDGQVVYWVRDNGVGFDPRYASKLFGVFQRLHGAADFEGTGIGLAIVERAISRHGGRVWAESVEGEGACFYFTLPPAGQEEETA
jgi:light-regulated signal transduction histidine kinase (bacteriophytochrome)